uniref:alpha-catulin-like isoform X2 n=1 Tax=Myxine glutinosa TaxID=7769 RepID=UPI00358EC4FA
MAEPRSIEIRTRSVEQTLSRLVSQITTLVNGVGTTKRRATRWGVSVAVDLGRAVERFVAFGEALAENQPQVKVSAMEACGDARRAGAMLAALLCLRDPGETPQKSPETAARGGSEMVAGHASQKNLPQPSSASLTTKVSPADRIDKDTKFSSFGSPTWKRASLSSLSGTAPSTHRDSRTISAHAGRLLLSSVSRMLMLADQTVVSQIESAGKQVQGSLRDMEVAKNMKDLVLTFNKYSEAVEEFVSLARYREEDLKDELEAAEMAAARDVLEKSPVVLLTSYKAWLKFPSCETAQVCRAGALDRIRHAVNSIMHLSMYGQQAGNAEAVAVPTSMSGSCSQPRMSTAIDNFKGIVERSREGKWSREEWTTYSDQLSALLSRAQIMSEAACVPDVSRDSVKGCIGQMSLELSECTMEMEVAVVALCRTLDNLKTQLREVATRVASLGAFEQSGSRTLARLEAAVVAGDTESVTGLARQLFKHSDGLVEESRKEVSFQVSDHRALEGSPQLPVFL